MLTDTKTRGSPVAASLGGDPGGGPQPATGRAAQDARSAPRGVTRQQRLQRRLFAEQLRFCVEFNFPEKASGAVFLAKRLDLISSDEWAALTRWTSAWNCGAWASLPARRRIDLTRLKGKLFATGVRR